MSATKNFVWMKIVVHSQSYRINLNLEIIAKFYSDFPIMSIVPEFWFMPQKLKYQILKSQICIFNDLFDMFTSVELKISNINIERKGECRFLGVTMDDKLNWSHHIASISLKMSRYIGIMF